MAQEDPLLAEQPKRGSALIKYVLGGMVVGLVYVGVVTTKPSGLRGDASLIADGPNLEVDCTSNSRDFGRWCYYKQAYRQCVVNSYTKACGTAPGCTDKNQVMSAAREDCKDEALRLCVDMCVKNEQYPTCYEDECKSIYVRMKR